MDSGVYADDNDVKKALSGKFGDPSTAHLQDGKDFCDEILDGDIPVVIRLQIVYGRLSIGSVRSAFKESVGSRLHKFGGPGNQELLERSINLLMLPVIYASWYIWFHTF